jgi:hypothetical protein
MKNGTSILGSHYNKFIKDKIRSRLLETEENKIQLLRNELELGEASPMIENFNSQKVARKIYMSTEIFKF